MARVTLGMPVYNGADYLAAALESLLAQDYNDFVIDISDNCSTDGTRALAESFAARDPRVTYSRTERNVGAVGNFNGVFARASSELFVWAAHDDLWHPTFLSRCVAALDARPDAVLAHTWVRFIDRDGRPHPEEANDFLDERADRGERFRGIVQDLFGPMCIYGVIRTAALRRTRLFQPLIGGDMLLLAELALHGQFVQVREPLWTYRTPGFAQREASVARWRVALQIEGRLSQRLVPRLRLSLEYLRVIAASDVPLAEKALLARHVLRWFGVDVLLLPVGRALLRQLLGDEKLAALLATLHEQPWYRRWRRIAD